MIRPVVRANHIDRRRGIRRINQTSQRHPKRLRDAKGHAERWIGLVSLDLAEHRPADTAGSRELLERPPLLLAKLPYTITKLAGDRVVFGAVDAMCAARCRPSHKCSIYWKRHLANRNCGCSIQEGLVDK